MKPCMHCHKENRDQACFCGHCGKPFLPEKPPPARKTPPWSRKTYPVLFVAALVFAILGKLFTSEGRHLIREEAQPISSREENFEPEDTPQNRRAAAEHHLRVMGPLDEVASEAIRQAAAQLPFLSEAERETLIRVMTHKLRQSRIKEAAVQALVKHFSVKELHTLTRFCRSAEGRAVLRKLRHYRAELMPLIMAEAMQAAQEALKELEAKKEKAKLKKQPV